MDQLSEHSVGALLFLFSTLTALTGELWGVNPFDQPGVEEGKVYTREFLTAERTEKADVLDAHSAVNRLRRES
jgi:glucose-6-phosphate isomerase